MQPSRQYKSVSWIANVALVISIHFDGFWAGPLAYLTAAKWWVLGKKVRARGQLAPLLGRSTKAYTLWARRDASARSANSTHGQLPPIVALVAAGGDQQALSLTLQSLADEGLQVFVIGAGQPADMKTAAAEIDWMQEPWLLALNSGDRLAPGAAESYRQAMAATKAVAIYADDDVQDKWGRRSAPHFKPDWNSELFCHFDYLTGACVIRVEQDDLAAVAGRANWAELLVKLAVARGPVQHVRKMLHFRAARINAPAAPRSLAVVAELPPVSIIVPTRNRLDLLQKCLEGVAATRYSDIEIIVVDNDSDDPATLAYLASIDNGRARVLRHPGLFNYSAINNRAAAVARGQLLCLLNNDIEVIGPDWLAIMSTQALRREVGAVGAQLLYPDGRIQHAGVVIGVGNAAGHAHRFVHPEAENYFRRHTLPQFTSAVTGACLVVARDKFLSVGGLDEQHFAVAFNDVDLCLRLGKRGWQALYEPRAVLIHHESVSRGLDDDPVGAARFAGELSALKRIWNTDKIVDPFHHPHLSRASEQFVFAL
jgi:GT2 family glycosyltransferase